MDTQHTQSPSPEIHGPHVQKKKLIIACFALALFLLGCCIGFLFTYSYFTAQSQLTSSDNEQKAPTATAAEHVATFNARFGETDRIVGYTPPTEVFEALGLVDEVSSTMLTVLFEGRPLSIFGGDTPKWISRTVEVTEATVLEREERSQDGTKQMVSVSLSEITPGTTLFIETDSNILDTETVVAKKITVPFIRQAVVPHNDEAVTE